MADVAQKTYGECENKEQQKSFQERLSDMPAYTMTLSQLGSFYSTLKEKNEVLKNAFTTGEEYVEKITNAAKPVVWAATQTALEVAKPVVGEISDPVGRIDSAASEALAKVQEKIPIVKQTPQEIAEQAKEAAKQTASYYLNKAQSSNVVQEATKQLDNVVSLSELVVEMCFPSDGSCPEDLKELEIAEQDEDKGLVVRAGNLKNKAVRRGKKKLMTYKAVQATVDNVSADKVLYAQQQISEMTEKVMTGTNYVKSKYPEVKSAVEVTLGKQWDKVYKTTMYIPNKAIQITGEVYISAQEMVFAYGQAHSVAEMPHAIVEMAEGYYNNLAKEVPIVEEIRGKAVGFALVPAQVISEYLESSRLIQWIVPKNIETSSIKVIETEKETTNDDLEDTEI